MRTSNLPKDLQDAKEVQQALKHKSETHWIERGQKMALELFHDMAKRVPAYKAFLQENQIDPATVKTAEDFSRLPTLDKDNYLRKYPLADLCWDGKFADNSWVVSTTSGSTGEPFYFPRTDLQDEYYALSAELYLRENFKIHERTTLYIDAFAMGAWIGGLFTYEAVKRVAEKGYNLTIITPGINKAEVLSSVRRLGANFDQVIIGCYPPIMKDIIDMGVDEDLNWADYNLGIVFSAEGFSEDFRDYVVDKAGMGDVLTSSLNHYGTVDLGTMSHETPLSIMSRRDAVANKELFAKIFGETRKLPTFTQYMPELFYFEQDFGSLICTSNSGLPLVRYDLKDNGGIITLEELHKAYKVLDKDLNHELDKNKISDTVWNLPFVYLYERSDFSVTFVGANIYPEEIRKALLQKHLQAQVTGKFTMEVVNDEKMDSKLTLNVELKKGVKPGDELIKTIQKTVVDLLLEENSEYASNYASYGERLIPEVILWPVDHPTYFSGRGKQKWVKK